MYSSIANNMFSYLLTMDEFRSIFPDEHKPSWVKLTTITMVSDFLDRIDVDRIRLVFSKLKTITVRKKGSKSGGFVWSLKDTAFYNQVTLTYKDAYSTKSIKVFPNGSIQVAGCCDIFDCKRIIKQLSCLFKTILNMDKELSGDNFRIVLINTNFSLNYNLNLYKLHDILHRYPQLFKISFNPESYAAILLKFKPAKDMKEITTSIFGTGKIIVTGAETLKEIVFAYRIINELIYRHRDEVKIIERETKEDFDIFMGYKIPELVPFLKKKGLNSWKFTRSNNQIIF